MSMKMAERILAGLPPGLSRLREAFRASDFDIRVVGGAVRDAAAGVVPKDVDLCTDANPEQQQAIYEAAGVRCIPTGLKHGTWTVILGGEPVEITSLRVDRETNGRHAEVEWTRDWRGDLARRDLTINAMSMTLDSEVLDPFGGIEDIRENRVRFVGSAEDRMREDYLRILRWLRFEGRFGLSGQEANPEAMAAARVCRDGLEGISRERVWSEFKRIISGPRANSMIALTQTLGLDTPCGLDIDNERLMSARLEGVHDPVALLAYSVPDIGALAERWKWSSEERITGIWLSSRLTEITADPKRMVASAGQRRDRVATLMRLQGRHAEAEAITAWEVPIFPVDGRDVEAMGIPKGREVGLALARMRECWTTSDYKTDAEALLTSERAKLSGGMKL